MAYNTFQQEYLNMPPITRGYTTACVLTTLAIQLDLVTPFQLYYNPKLILQGQVWRIFTNFLYLGPIGFSFLFNMVFTYRYCRMLEENSFRGRTADFLFMFLYGGMLMCLAGLFVNLVFFGHAFTMMLVYIWARRNPYIRLNFFGIMGFQAPYLPWVLFLFSVLFGNPILMDLVGIATGHLYFFLEDVFPRGEGGFHVLRAPEFVKRLLERGEESDPAYDPMPEDRPGGYNWGNVGEGAEPAANEQPVDQQ